jgi:hypothetical protein
VSGNRVDPARPRVLFGCSNGASWVAQLALDRPEPFAEIAVPIGAAPRPVPRRSPRYALVAGRLEAGFDRTTTACARRLRLDGVPVRLRRRLRSHDASMWQDDFVPALRLALDS